MSNDQYPNYPAQPEPHLDAQSSPTPHSWQQPSGASRDDGPQQWTQPHYGAPSQPQYGAPSHGGGSAGTQPRQSGEIVRVGPFTLREVLIGGAWLALFVFSFFSVQTGLYGTVWTGPLSWVLTVMVPTVAVVLLVVRRLAPRTRLRVGSLSVDQFASVAFSVAAFAWFSLLWATLFAILRGFGPSWALWLALLMSLGLVALSVTGPFIFPAEFDNRTDASRHRVARAATALPAIQRAHAVATTRGGDNAPPTSGGSGQQWPAHQQGSAQQQWPEQPQGSHAQRSHAEWTQAHESLAHESQAQWTQATGSDQQWSQAVEPAPSSAPAPDASASVGSAQLAARDHVAADNRGAHAPDIGEDSTEGVYAGHQSDQAPGSYTSDAADDRGEPGTYVDSAPDAQQHPGTYVDADESNGRDDLSATGDRSTVDAEALSDENSALASAAEGSPAAGAAGVGAAGAAGAGAAAFGAAGSATGEQPAPRGSEWSQLGFDDLDGATTRTDRHEDGVRPVASVSEGTAADAHGRSASNEAASIAETGAPAAPVEATDDGVVVDFGPTDPAQQSERPATSLPGLVEDVDGGVSSARSDDDQPVVSESPVFDLQAAQSNAAPATEFSDAAPATEFANAAPASERSDAAPASERSDAASGGSQPAAASEAPQPVAAAALQPFWALVPVERDVVDERGVPIFTIGPTAWALVLEDRGSVYVVRHDDGRMGFLLDVTGITRG